jgi:phage regulator Rha-like protein
MLYLYLIYTMLGHTLFNIVTFQLQEAVVEMKSAFVQALQQLGTLEAEERAAREEQDKARADTERQLAEALKLLIAFKVIITTAN